MYNWELCRICRHTFQDNDESSISAEMRYKQVKRERTFFGDDESSPLSPLLRKITYRISSPHRSTVNYIGAKGILKYVGREIQEQAPCESSRLTLLYYSRPASGKHCCGLVFVYIQSGDERNQLKYIAYVKYICSINYELLFYTEYNPLLLCCQLSCQIFPSPTAGAF